MATMAKHADVFWDARCGESAVTAVETAEVDAVSRTRNASKTRRSPDQHLSPDRQERSSPNRRPPSGPDSHRCDSSLCFYHDKWGSKA